MNYQAKINFIYFTTLFFYFIKIFLSRLYILAQNRCIALLYCNAYGSFT